MKKTKRGLDKRIIGLSNLGHRQCEIAKLVGCSTANVHQVLKRRGMTPDDIVSRRVMKLEEKHRAYLLRAAREMCTTIDDVVRNLLVSAIDLAIEEEMDLKLKYTTNQLEDIPLPAKLLPRPVANMGMGNGHQANKSEGRNRVA